MFNIEPVWKVTQMFLQCMIFFYMNTKTAQVHAPALHTTSVSILSNWQNKHFNKYTRSVESCCTEMSVHKHSTTTIKPECSTAE